MVVARDDVKSLTLRSDGESVVCAVVISLNPARIRDESGSVELEKLPSSGIEVGDLCYLLFQCKRGHPPECIRATPIPSHLTPIARYQLIKYRQYINTNET